jgi:hypothetical protein
MQRRFILGLLCLALLTSPIWVFILRNEFSAFQLKAKLGSAALPAGADVLASFSRVFNAGNSDGCDYQAIEIIQYYGDFANLQSSYVNLIHSMSAERPVMEQGGNPFRWGAKISSLQVEFSIVPNTDHAGQYLVSVTSYVRDLSRDFRCW